MRCLFLIPLLVLAPPALGVTSNIMLTGYWPPTNEMLRQFSTNPAQNPDGWAGLDWEGRGYNIYSYFPEFSGPDDLQGSGDFEVDYQDTTADFDRIADELDPVAIITFSRGGSGFQWELERRQRNLDMWEPDFDAPVQPDNLPPDPTVPAGFIRESSLPMDDIVAALGDSQVPVVEFIDDTGFGGGFLSEYIAYLGTWYHDRHADPADPAWNIAAGHIHVGRFVSPTSGRLAAEVTLRTLTDYLDTRIPEPTTVLALAVAAVGALRRR